MSAAWPLLAFLGLLLLATNVYGQGCPVCECDASSEDVYSCPNGVDEVVLQLRWLKKTQFAGYYAADNKGYWAKECLKVTIKPIDFNFNVHDLNAAGAHFGLPWYLEFLALAVEEEMDVMHISQVFTRPGWRWATSPVYETEATKNVKSFADLAGLTISASGVGQDKTMYALLNKHGLDFCGHGAEACTGGEDVTILPGGFSVDEITGGSEDGIKAHAMVTAMAYNQVVTVIEWGVQQLGRVFKIGPPEEGGDFQVFDPAKDDGISIPEDGLMVNRTWLLSDPKNEDITVRFLKGAYKGWIYCRDNAQECVDIVSPKRSEDDAQFNERWSMHEVNKLIWPATYGIGTHVPSRVQSSIDIAKEYGVITKEVPYEEHTVDTYTMQAINELKDEGYDVEGQYFTTPAYQAQLEICIRGGNEAIICEESSAVTTMVYGVAGGAGGLLLIVGVAVIYFRRKQAKKSNPLIGINVKKVLQDVWQDVQPISAGDVADYIPELGKANPEHFAIALVTTSGKIYSVGDVDQRFTIQSAGKPFMYAYLLNSMGEEWVNRKINVEPSGAAFNSDVLDPMGRPFNPLINQGAIASCCLMPDELHAQQRFDALKDFMTSFSNSPLSLDRKVYQSESSTGDQNRKIAQKLLESGCVETEFDMKEGLESYFMACSALVDTVGLATMAATVANKGKNPVSKKSAIDEDLASTVGSVMMTCGMYDGAGNWMRDVGLPAKSGVSGCVMAVVPGVCGLAVFSPRLNANGNSVRGIETCTMLSERLNLHVLKKDRSSKGKNGNASSVSRMDISQTPASPRKASSSTIKRVLVHPKQPTDGLLNRASETSDAIPAA